MATCLSIALLSFSKPLRFFHSSVPECSISHVLRIQHFTHVLFIVELQHIPPPSLLFFTFSYDESLANRDMSCNE